MLTWIATYWLDVLFTVVLGVLAWGGKKLIYFCKKEVKNILNQTEKRILDKIEAKDAEQDKKMDELRAGLLSVQGRQFKEKCHKLLEVDHKITVDELEIITEDHLAYKGLGGNHEGDILFNLVVEKAKKDIGA